MRTAPSETGLHRLLRARWGRRAFFIGTSLFLLLGALGVFGVRMAEVSGTGGGYEVTVTYAEVSRPGLATPWEVEVRRPGGFGAETLRLATTSTYFDIFDENGLDPTPMEATSDAERTIWTFTTPPAGDILTASFDARIEPAVQLTTAQATTAVLDGAEAVASVSYATFVMP